MVVSRAYRRIVFLVIVLFTICGLIIASRKPNQLKSLEFLDSVTHLSLHSNNDQQNHPSDRGKHQQDGKQEDKQKSHQLDPCTVFNPINHGFIDLRSLSSQGNEGRALPWTSKGYETGYNYTLGICSSPFKQNHDKLNELKDDLNSLEVGGYYIDPKTNQYVSIGQYNENPVFKGRKLTLTYENGSYCDNLVDSTTGQKLKKSTILTFTCDREMSAKAHILYIGSVNNCNYVFEVRSHHACPTAAKADNLAAVWIFLLILVAALAVYFSGGLLYKQMKSARLTQSPSKY